MKALLLILVVASFGLTACADRDEVAAGKRSYQGKPDTHSWDNAPQERASLEAQLKLRQLAQDENRRISQ
ncbi:MAG TPA: hypothetical protein VNG04_08130 [Candidatus Acidoferrum sp.]|jgi:hypothetical protein|nr:hypothetical protein [Candidatus Acidoferrum sp.]